MKCKVSVIVPVYNAGKYLKEMANSLLSQTCKEMEFIFVDDCSTDNSLEILSELEKADEERIIIIKLDKNQGPGAARNIGIRYASGEYIGFADSDDLVKSNMYECMYEKAIENDYEIVECGYYNERKNQEIILWDYSIEGEVSLENRVKMIMSCGFICCKLYKREFIIDSGIEFIPEIPLEDVDFLNRLYCRVNRVGIVNEILYYYRNNSESFSNKRNGQKVLDINNKFCKIYLHNMKKERLYEILKPVIEYVILWVWFDTFKQYVSENNGITLSGLEVIDNEIKKYVADYGNNMFFVEKAKYDILKKAFLENSYDVKKAKKTIDNI